MGQSPESASYNADSEGLPFYQGNADFGETHPSARTWCSAPKKTAKPGDILLSVRAPVGAVNVADEKCCIGRGLAAIRPRDSSVNSNFLVHFLKSKRTYLESASTGSTFKAIGKKTLSSCPLPVYSRDSQNQIALQLDGMDACLRNSKKQLAALDDLVKSEFVEMFGDAKTIVSNWDLYLFEDCVSSFESGSSPNCRNEPREGDEPGVLKLSALSTGRFIPTENKAMFDGEAINPDKEVKCGDVLIARKNTPALVGSCVLVREQIKNLMFPDIVFRVHPSKAVNGEYLCALLSGPSFSGDLKALAHGSAKSMSNISKSNLAKLYIPVPPLALQQQFADFVAEVDKLRFDVQQQIEKLETLKQSLMQDYFG